MIVIILFIGLIIGFNFIPQLTKTHFPIIEKIILRVLISSTILFLLFILFDFNGYRVKGIYTLPIISLIFIILTILYFTLFKNTKKKIFTILFLAPLIILSISILLFGQVKNEYRIDNKIKISVRKGGFLSCGEEINISESKLGLFDKEIYYDSSLCLIGINKIKVVKIDNKHAEFLIYHNGEHDSENPYKYDVERKNVW